jgi:hypothetical protein
LLITLGRWIWTWLRLPMVRHHSHDLPSGNENRIEGDGEIDLEVVGWRMCVFRARLEERKRQPNQTKIEM